MTFYKRTKPHMGVSPLVKVLNSHIPQVKGTRQGTGSLDSMKYKTETIVDTSKMSPEEKAEYIKQFKLGK